LCTYALKDLRLVENFWKQCNLCVLFGYIQAI